MGKAAFQTNPCEIEACATDVFCHRSSVIARKLVTDIEVSRAHVHDMLGKLAKTDEVEVSVWLAEHGAHLYHVTAGLPTTPRLVDLESDPEDGQIANNRVYDTSTWVLTIRSPTVSHSAADTPERSIRTGDQDGSHDEEVGLEVFNRGPPTG